MEEGKGEREGQPGALTWEILKAVFPVANSEKRARADIFGDLVPDGNPRDDATFYSALLERMRSDSGYLLRLETAYRASERRKDRDKSFVSRALRWLSIRHPKPAIDALLDDSSAVFAEGTVERGLEELIRTVIHSEPCSYSTTGEPEESWQDALALVKSLASDLVDPSVGEIDALLDACGRLRTLVERDHESRKACMLQRQELIEGLRSKLSAWIALEPVADFCSRLESLDLASLSAVEVSLAGTLVPILDEVDSLNGEQESLQAELDAAREEKNWSRMAEISVALSGLDSRIQDAKDAVARFLNEACQGAGAVSGVDSPASGEEGQDPDDRLQSQHGGTPDTGQVAEAESQDRPSGEEATGSPSEPRGEVEVSPEPEAAAQVQEKSVEAPEPTVTPPIAPGSDVPSGGEPEDAGEKPVMRPDRDANLAIAGYLKNGQDALAWHLARLVRPDALEIPASVIRALAIAPCVTGPYQNASSHIGEALAESMEDLRKFEQQDRPSADAVRMLLFASMLRPAVLAPHSTARQHLQVFSMAGELAPLAGLQQALASLGHDFSPQADDLRELAGTESNRRAPDAVRRLREWRQRAEGATSLHQPTTMIFQGMLKDTGEIGSLVEAIVSGHPAASEMVQKWVGRYLSERSEQEALVGELERKSGRPGKDAIVGKAMDWICRKIQEGTEHLRDWLEAHSSDRGLLDDRSRRALLPKVTHLENLVSAALDIWSPSQDGDRVHTVARGRVARALDELKALISGADDQPDLKVSTALSMPLRMLPAICIPRAEGFAPAAAFALERSQQEQALLDALLAPDEALSSDLVAALRDRLAEGAVLASREIIDHLRAYDSLDEDHLTEYEDEWEEVLERERIRLLEEVEAVRLGLSTLYNLDLSNGEELRAALETADAIAVAVEAYGNGDERGLVTLPAGDERRPGIPADFPEARAMLAKIRSLQSRIEKGIRRDQRERLEQIAVERPELKESIGRHLPLLANRDPVAVEDLVASLKAGHGIATIDEGRTDAFEEFFPAFVDALAAAKVNKGQVDTALADGGQIGPLDFSRLDEDLRRGGRQLLSAWRQVDNALHKPGRDWKTSVVSVLEGLGFTSVKLAQDATALTGKLRSTSFRSEVPASEGWFLPPEFGSLAGGAYRLYLCSPEQDFRGVVDEMVKVAGDSPAVVLMFGTLGSARRREFARIMRGRRQRALLVDEAQVLFLISRNSGRFQTLVECAVPFGYVQPYTTDPGSIPREMFFGRKEEIARIQARSADGCLVYGGRQLGKSALLNHVRKMFHAPAQGQIVCYRSCDSLGLESEPASFIWRIMAQLLDGVVEFPKATIGPDEFCPAVERWLEEEPGRRIVMLLDETDHFMSSEARLGYFNLTKAKDLMVRAGWRFKVVFAGLHNVRRAWKAPNTPLAHLGDPICVGPLSTSAENMGEARRLVVDPVRAAGFEFERPEIGWDILARVNHYPSLVQVFCKELLGELHRTNEDTRPSGPRWAVSRSMVFEGPRYRQINDAIRGKFRLTLDLDPRYDLIANVLALHRFEEGDHPVLRTGLPVAELYRQVLNNWPESLEKLRLEEFRAILDEMVDLGVLSALGPRRDQYGLRTAQVAHMLGTKDEVESQLLQIMDMEPRVDYDSALFFRRLEFDIPSCRAVLSDAQLDALFGKEPAISRVVVAASGHDVDVSVDRLATAGRLWVGGGVPRVADVHIGDRSGFREALRRLGRAQMSGALLVISERSGWEPGWMDWADAQVEVRSGSVIPVFVASTSRFCAGGQEAWGDRPVFIPKPWGDQMLRAWLAECDGNMFDHPGRRKRIISGTGGLPGRIVRATGELFQRCRRRGADIDGVLRMWEREQSIGRTELDIPGGLMPLVDILEDLDGPGDFESFVELASEELALGKADVERQLGLLNRLGLIEWGERRVHITPLGRLLKKGAID